MKRESIEMEEIISRQAAFLGTIQSVPGDDSRIKVTTFLSSKGCTCTQAITVKKEIIDSLL
jgi:hypothetical protein